MFNAIKWTQELERAGFTRDQAEASVKILIDVMNENFATKQDLKETELRLLASIERLDSKIESSIERLDSKIESSIERLDSKIDRLDGKGQSSLKELEYKLTLKLGTLMAVGIGVIATLLKF